MPFQNLKHFQLIADIVFQEGNQAMHSRDKPEVCKIQYIEDKKIQRNGSISYLVKYRGINQQNWASKQYLTTDPENKKCILRYEKLMEQFKKDQQSPSDSHDQVEISKSKRTAKKQKKAIKIIQRASKSQKNPKSVPTVGKKIDLVIKKPVEASRENKNQKDSEDQFYSEVEVDSSELIPQLVENNSKVTKKQQVVKQKVNQPKIEKAKQQKKGEGDFKIVRAQTNNEGCINFQVKYENGVQIWVEGDKIKKEHPLKVIGFYEKRITWNC